jgi:hypothetical protein
MADYVAMPELPASPETPVQHPKEEGAEIAAVSVGDAAASSSPVAKTVSHRQQAATEAVSGLRIACEQSLRVIRSSLDQDTTETEAMEQYRLLDDALLAFQRAMVYKGRRKTAILRCNRAPGTFSVPFRLRTLLARSDLYPVMVGPLESLATVASDAVVTVSSLLCSLGKCVEAELLCHQLCSAVVLSYSQVDAVVATQGRAVAALCQSAAPIQPSTLESSDSDRDADVSFASTAPTDDQTNRLKRIERDAKARMDVTTFRRLVADWLAAPGDESSQGSVQDAPQLKGLQAVVSTVLRALFGFAVLPWPRLHPMEWVCRWFRCVCRLENAAVTVCFVVSLFLQLGVCGEFLTFCDKVSGRQHAWMAPRVVVTLAQYRSAVRPMIHVSM